MPLSLQGPRRWIRAALRASSAAALLAAAPVDAAFVVDQLFSNADGTIQFVVLRETSGQDDLQHFAGQSLTVTSGGRARTLTFPTDLGSADTSRRSVLIATRGYADAARNDPQFAAVPPDYVMDTRFLSTAGGTIAFGADAYAYPALPSDGFSAVYRTGETIRDNRAQNFTGANFSVPISRVTAVEYYNATLDHYFISDLAPDIDALDAGRIPGWTRTGQAFNVWPASLGFLRPVCRFYIPPEHGNSHFFSASAAECTTVAGLATTNPSYSGYDKEADDAFYVALPFVDGACPTKWAPVYRLWNQRADSNHRYTTDAAIKAQMIAKGYVAEGYGPDAVAMCAPLDF
jgi:hypothetical protein